MTHATSLRQGTKPLVINGHTMSLAAVNAAARYGTPVLLDNSSEVKGRVKRSKATLDDKLRAKKSIYGVSTGYGGSGECLFLRISPRLILCRSRYPHGLTWCSRGLSVPTPTYWGTLYPLRPLRSPS